MSAIAYLMVSSESFNAEYSQLPADFVSRFVSTAKANGTLATYREPERPDVIFMRGTDAQKRSLLGVWSIDPAAIIDRQRIVVFREVQGQSASAYASRTAQDEA